MLRHIELAGKSLLVLGGAGMLGSDVVPEAKSRDMGVCAPSAEELDITNPAEVARIAIGDFGKLDWCINCAAYTAVDQAETKPDLAANVNALAPASVARACSIAGCRLLHLSTDFVFDGEQEEPYDEAGPTNPINTYGLTKRDGEEAVQSAAPGSLIVRTSWLFGPNGNCFPTTVAKAWESGKQLRVVGDQFGNPTYTGDLARTLLDLIEADPSGGIYHAVGPDRMSWHRLAELATKVYGKANSAAYPTEVEEISSEQWPTRARRPKNSSLADTKLKDLGIKPMRPIEEALGEHFARMAAQAKLS